MSRDGASLGRDASRDGGASGHRRPTVDACPLHIELPPDLTSPARARAFVREHLSTDSDVRANAELIVSELVTNGVLHARTHMSLGLAPEAEHILVAVKDENDGAPIGRLAAEHAQQAESDQYAENAENGRGLYLLETLSADWGVVSHAHGKTVWARLRLPGDAPPKG